MKKYTYKNLFKGKVLLVQDFERFAFAIDLHHECNFTDEVVVLSFRLLFWGIEIFLYEREKW